MTNFLIRGPDCNASEQLGVPAALFCVRDGSRSFAMPEALLLGTAGITSYEVIRSNNIDMGDPLRSDSLHKHANPKRERERIKQESIHGAPSPPWSKEAPSEATLGLVCLAVDDLWP